MTAAQQPDYIRKIDEYEKQMIEDLKSLAKLESCFRNGCRNSYHGENRAIVVPVGLNIEQCAAWDGIAQIYQSLKDLRVSLFTYAEIWNAFYNLIHKLYLSL